MSELTKAQLNFIDNFIANDFQNASAAYRKAYPKSKAESARREASRLLTNVDIKTAIGNRLDEIMGEKKIGLEKRIVEYWMIRAFYDPTEIVDINGKLKISQKKLKKTGLYVCIDSINKKVNSQGYETIEYKFADKDKAADMLSKYLAMIHEKVDVTGTVDLQGRAAEILEAAKNETD
ncbi:phage terminase small subunit [Spirochaetia bacterium]|nr:phage terminase small subunit [Spirochaetia bacterium]